MENKVIYTPFISKPFELPESQAIAPIPISFPIPEYRGANPDREVIPIHNMTPKQEESKPTKKKTDTLKQAREVLTSRKPKGSHKFKTSDIKVGNMQGFLDEASKRGIYFRITSGIREGATTKNGNMSNHATGDAIDITPLDGQSWDELITQIKNSPELLDYMRKHKMRILDERSSEILAQTGGTGAHFHISFGKTEGKGVDEYFV